MAGAQPRVGVLMAVCEGTDTAFGLVSFPGVQQKRRVVVQEDAAQIQSSLTSSCGVRTHAARLRVQLRCVPWGGLDS